MEHWKQIFQKNYTCREKLADFLELDDEKRAKVLERPPFPLNLPRRLAEKAQKNSLDDPIIKQFLPLDHERVFVPGYEKDPVQDERFQKNKKLLHKYEGRALLLTSSACAMHCRFCFRQNFPYAKKEPGFEEELAYIRDKNSLKEIILSGGDPLSLDDLKLRDLLLKIDDVPHVERIRFHTRFPIGIPERIDDFFLETLEMLKKQVFFTIHINHPVELDPDLITALQRLLRLGIPVLTQTVLLKGVNAEKPILQELFEKLTKVGILPYYLHHLDPVHGSAPFELSMDEGRRLVEDLRNSLSGYAVPRYVQEVPGEKAKTILF